MREYTGFASVYDMFMDNVPYDEWAEYLHDLLRENGVEKGIVCELGCGTGKMTRRLKRFGYDMIGIDFSQEMLQIAAEHEEKLKEVVSSNKTKSKKEAENNNPGGKNGSGEILYLNQDMREFELYGTVAAVVSVCDSMNYITEKDDLLQVFKLVNNYLDPGGVFIFDMNTPYYYSKILGEQTICENREEGSFIWENYFHEDEKVNEYDLTIFLRREGELFERVTETHLQRGYEPAEIQMLLERAGLQVLIMRDADRDGDVVPESERVYVVAKECKKSLNA